MHITYIFTVKHGQSEVVEELFIFYPILIKLPKIFQI